MFDVTVDVPEKDPPLRRRSAKLVPDAAVRVPLSRERTPEPLSVAVAPQVPPPEIETVPPDPTETLPLLVKGALIKTVPPVPTETVPLLVKGTLRVAIAVPP